MIHYEQVRVGKLRLVDLAGSERAARTGANGQRLEEGAAINVSLMRLANCIEVRPLPSSCACCVCSGGSSTGYHQHLRSPALCLRLRQALAAGKGAHVPY